MTSTNQRSGRAGNLTDHQIGILVEQFTGQAERIIEIIDMLNAYAKAGGRDWASYERIFDHPVSPRFCLVDRPHQLN